MTFRNFVESREIQPNEEERSFILQVVYGLQHNSWDAALVYADYLEERNDPSQLHTIIRLVKEYMELRDSYNKLLDFIDAKTNKDTRNLIDTWKKQNQQRMEDVHDQFHDALQKAEPFLERPSPEWSGMYSAYYKLMPDGKHRDRDGSYSVKNMRFYYYGPQYGKLYDKKLVPLSRIPTPLLKAGLLRHIADLSAYGKIKLKVRTGVKPYTPPQPQPKQQPEPEDDPYRQ